MQPHIAITVDHPLRDLGGCVLIAEALVAQGARVSLVPMNVMNSEIFALRPDLVLLNYLRTNNEAFVRNLIQANIRYAILDTEGGLYTDLATYTRVFPTARDVLGHTRVYCSWGKKVSDELVRQQIFSAGQIAITGLPRFDPYAHKATHHTSDQRKRVLINTKVAIANPGNHSVDKELDLYINKMGWKASDVYAMRDTGIATIRETLAMANRLARDFPHIDFIIRPHPHERVSTYQEGIEPDLTNLRASLEGSIDEWIPTLTALIHRSCTTAIEATLARVPALSPDWIPTSAAAADCDAVSIHCVDYEAMRLTLASIINGTADAPSPPTEILQRITNDWFYKIDGLAHKRVAEAIWPHMPTHREVNTARCDALLARRNEPWFHKRGGAALLLNIARPLMHRERYLNMLYPGRRTWAQGIKGYGREQVKQKIAAPFNVQPSSYVADFTGFSLDIVRAEGAV